MALLKSIQNETIDPDYARAVGKDEAKGWRSLTILATIVAGLLIGSYATSAGSGADPSQNERDDLLIQIDEADRRNHELASRDQELRTEINDLEAERLGYSPEISAEAIWAADTAVNGPGVVITLEDNAGHADGLIVDQDLRQVVNGLWLAGAEAISINGHRLSAKTAIRQAGSAITVDYRSISSPYSIEAIGDPATLRDGFLGGDGGRWLDYLAQRYQVEWSVKTVDQLSLAADIGVNVSYATPLPTPS